MTSRTSVPSPSRFSTVLLDPPWTYQDKALAGNRGAGCKYPLLTIEHLKQLDVPNILSPDAAVFMWATMPLLQEALDLYRAWGLTYKTCAFTWVKQTSLGKRWNWGMGRWTRANAELVLLGTQGHPKRVSAGVHSIVETPIEKHSKKPGIVHDRIVQLVGDVPRCELFARRESPGWVCTGLDLDGVDVREFLAAPESLLGLRSLSSPRGA